MKIGKLIIKVIIVFLFASCSSDDSEIDSSFITDYSWKLINFNLPQPVDLNLDGISSIDMAEEFDCLQDESFLFYSNGDVKYSHSNLLLVETHGGGIVTERYECSDTPVIPFIRLGSFRMIDENTIELTIDAILDYSEFILQYKFENNKLTQTITLNYPVSYNQETGTFTREIIEVKKVFIPE